MQSNKGSIALAHNGNLVNAQHVRARLESQGSIFQTNSDTEVIVHLIARSQAAAACKNQDEQQGRTNVVIRQE